MGPEQRPGLERLPPISLDPYYLGPTPCRNVAHPLTEHPVNPNDHHVARSKHVDEGGLHTSRTSSRHREGERVRGPEDLAESVVRLVEQRYEIGIEVAKNRTTERRDDLRVGVPGPRAHENAIRVRHYRQPNRLSLLVGKIFPNREVRVRFVGGTTTHQRCHEAVE